MVEVTNPQALATVNAAVKKAQDAGLPLPKVEAYMLVRDRHGKPKIDGDPRNLHHSIIDAMTADEMAVAIKEWDQANGKT